MPVQIQPWNMVKGSPDAPIQIYMFTDFQCPACRRFEKMLKTILADYSEDQYRLVYKHFPLGNDCNPLVPKENPMINHPQACSLAALAQAANEMGRFWDIKSMLYGYRDGDDLAVTIQQISIRSGISYSEWDKLAHDHDNLRKVVLDLGEALKLGVRGAPMVLINNRPLPSLRSRDVAQVIRLALEKKVAPLPASAAAGTESGPVGPAALPPEPPLTTPGPQATPVPGKPGPGL
ncbi:thioredoxin domain-containing protein [Candidatus Sumerlaeota bacterium]|nr:thioredoxin domain-containing protein [Candidatus Sumerlaeota bacterium]